MFYMFDPVRIRSNVPMQWLSKRCKRVHREKGLQSPVLPFALEESFVLEHTEVNDGE
jgi:hypothetical protein